MKSQNTRGKLKSNRNTNSRTYSRSPGHPSQKKIYSRSPGHPSQMKSQNTRGKLKSNRNKNRRTYSRSPGNPSRRKPATRNQVDKIGDRQTTDYGSIANDAADTYDEIRNTKQVKKIRKSLWERTKNKLSKVNQVDKNTRDNARYNKMRMGRGKRTPTKKDPRDNARYNKMRMGRGKRTPTSRTPTKKDPRDNARYNKMR